MEPGRVGAGGVGEAGGEKAGSGTGSRKGLEVGDKCEMLIFAIYYCVRILSKQRTQNII